MFVLRPQLNDFYIFILRQRRPQIIIAVQMMAAVKNILPAPDPERVHHATVSNDYWDTVCAVDTRHTWCHGRASRDQQRGPLGQTSMLHFPNPSISKTNCRLSRLPSAATSRSGEQDNTTFLLGLIRRRQDTSNHTDESGHACVGMRLFYLSPPPSFSLPTSAVIIPFHFSAER